MRHRWTMQELKTMSDAEIIRGIVQERRSDCTNPYTPFAERLDAILKRLDGQISTEHCKAKEG